jgi:hypothetical protein
VSGVEIRAVVCSALGSWDDVVDFEWVVCSSGFVADPAAVLFG